MPTRYERLEPYIAHLIWDGLVTYDEIDATGKQGRAYFATLGELPVVLLISMQDAQLPLDLARVRALLRAEQDTSLGMVLVGKKAVVQLGGKVLANVFRKNVDFADTFAEGLEKARAMRDDYFSKNRKPDP